MAKTFAEVCEEQGERRDYRNLLRMVLEHFLGPIPKEIQELINAEQDVERLSDAVLAAAHLKSYAEFGL